MLLRDSFGNVVVSGGFRVRATVRAQGVKALGCVGLWTLGMYVCLVSKLPENDEGRPFVRVCMKT